MRDREHRPRLPAHGTRARYMHRTNPCACDACRLANTRYQQRYRRRLAAGPQPQQLELPGMPEAAD